MKLGDPMHQPERDRISDWSLTERLTVAIQIGIALSMVYLLLFG